MLATGLRKSPLGRWGLDAFSELDRFANAVGVGNGSQFAVQLDVREDDNHYVIEADLPGFKKEDVDVTFQDGVLTFSGERTHEQAGEGKNYHYIERRTGRFARSVRLPDGVDPDSVDASLKDGVLTVRLAKTEEVKPRRIEVKC